MEREASALAEQLDSGADAPLPHTRLSARLDSAVERVGTLFSWLCLFFWLSLWLFLLLCQGLVNPIMMPAYLTQAFLDLVLAFSSFQTLFYVTAEFLVNTVRSASSPAHQIKNTCDYHYRHDDERDNEAIAFFFLCRL